jgi:predicted acyl esterase
LSDACDRARLPYAVREIEHAWIPLRDGSRLAARLWLPEGAERAPAVIEYIPYGKRSARASATRRCTPGSPARVRRTARRPARSGESSGVLLDEYLPQEQATAPR